LEAGAGPCYGDRVAMQSEDDPIRAEGQRVLEETPGLEEELTEFERRLDAGEIPRSEMHSTAAVRRRLRRVKASPELQ
jgi:hypothetical protein